MTPEVSSVLAGVFMLACGLFAIATFVESERRIRRINAETRAIMADIERRRTERIVSNNPEDVMAAFEADLEEEAQAVTDELAAAFSQRVTVTSGEIEAAREAYRLYGVATVRPDGAMYCPACNRFHPACDRPH